MVLPHPLQHFWCSICWCPFGVEHKAFDLFLKLNSNIWKNGYGFSWQRCLVLLWAWMWLWHGDFCTGLHVLPLLHNIYLSCSKAPDLENHYSLVRYLCHHGLLDPFAKWMPGYLDGRRNLYESRQYLFCSSPWNMFECSSGLCPAPSLFTTFVNDSNTVINSARVVKFANDINMHLSPAGRRCHCFIMIM